MTAVFVPFPTDALDRSIPDRFAEQVTRHADRIAVRDRRQTLTYRELGIAVDRIALSILRRRGPSPEPIAILLDQGAVFVQATLGVLNAGKFFVPLDPTHPPARLRAMLEDSAAALILTDANRMSLAVELIGYPEQAIDLALTEAISTSSFHRPVIGSDALAYVYYTSGSTGRPKGVMDSHRNVMHNIMRYTNSLRVSADDRLTNLHSSGNSGAVSDVFGALLVGAALLPFDLRREGLVGLAAWIEHERPTIYHSAPAIFRHMAMSAGLLSSLRLIRLEGDQASPRDLDLYRARCATECVLVNGLGLTECGLVRQYFVDSTTPIGKLVPIGYPVQDMEVSVIDPAGSEVSAGEIGEIIIESPFLSLGYWGRPDLTAERFSMGTSPPGVRRYRTGDLGRLRPDGCLEYLGRTDFQPKVRGYRIDAEEIEAALARHGQVREALVMLCEDAPGDPQLVAYVATQGETVSTSELRESLKQRLPDYMLPSAFVILNALPLTPNGKVDRRSLPAPDENRFVNDAQQPIPPRDVVEVQLFRIWEDLLDQHPVGVNYDFFELGGHSLLALQVVDRVNRMFDRDLPIDILWHGGRTIETLASILRDRAGSGEAIWSRAVPIKPSGSRRPLFCAPVVEGHLHIYENLGRRLHPDQPLYGLPVQGADGQEPPDATIEAIAAHGIRLMRKVQSTGPYSLLGYCSAGVVAFEMARQLEAMGDSVALLVLADSNAPGNYYRVWAHMLPNALRGRELRLLQERIYQLVLHPLGLRRLRRFKKLGEVHRWALMCYKPDPIKGSAVLIRVSEGLMSRDPALGWNRFIRGGVEVRTLPGRHGDLVTDKAAAQFAAELANFLD